MPNIILRLSRYLFFTKYQVENGDSVFLIFSGRTAKNIRVSEKVYNFLINNELDKINGDTKNKLFEQKVIVPRNENEYEKVNIENKKLLESRNKDMLYLSIQPTAYCQLACDYCGQEHTMKNMDDKTIETVVERINYKLDNSNCKSLGIGWFGGEPLFALKQMRMLNEKIKAITQQRNIEYFGQITSNGYVLTSALYKELKDEFNVKKIEITLDGTKEYHDRHRYTITNKGSFDKIFANLIDILNSPFFDKTSCPISIRCNVDKRNLKGVIPLMEEFVKYKIQNKVSFYYTCIVSWAKNGAGNENAKKELGAKTSEYIAFMIKHGFKTSILPRRMPPFICMATNKESEMYDAYGNIFDCSETSYSSVYRNTEFELGNVKNDKSDIINRSCLNKYPNLLMEGQFQPCKDCKFYPLCGGLCALALYEKEPRCPSFIYNIEDRMLLDFVYREITQKNKDINSAIKRK